VSENRKAVGMGMNGPTWFVARFAVVVLVAGLLRRVAPCRGSSIPSGSSSTARCALGYSAIALVALMALWRSSRCASLAKLLCAGPGDLSAFGYAFVIDCAARPVDLTT
jgi:hypothetical protein